VPYQLDCDPDDRNRWLVVDPAQQPDTRLYRAVQHMRSVGIADTIVRPYARAGLRFFTWYWERTTSAALPFTPFDSDEQVRVLLDSAIQSMEGKIRVSATEADVRYVEGDDDVMARVQDLISGVAYLYEGLIHHKYYSFPNPIILPIERRRPAFIPMVDGGRGSRRVMTKFFYRVAGIERPGPRVDDPSLVYKVIEALNNFRRTPKAIILLVKISIWGLARLREQTRLTIWDWWKASRFGKLIDTTNKGKRERRTKQQLIPDDLVEELTEWGNGDRQKLDLHGRTLEQWREFLLNESETVEKRMREAKATPLIPNARKSFYTSSGIRDVWYAPAMRAAGLPTRFHFLRHAGVCDANAMIDALEVSEAEKTKLKIAFGRQLGWAWPERMVEWYNTAQAKTLEIEIAAAWQRDRRAHLQLIMGGAVHSRPRHVTQIKQVSSDSAVKKLLGFKTGKGRPEDRKQAA